MSSQFAPFYKPVLKAKSIPNIGMHGRTTRAIFWGIIITLLLFSRHPIVGSSMYPTFHNGQNAIAFKALVPINRGQVVVAFAPDGKLLIKRTIGLPGDEIEIRNDGKIYVNNEESPYGSGNALIGIRDEIMQDNGLGGKLLTLGKDEYFLVGDNHENSADSRVFGPFKRSDIWEVVLNVF